MSRARLGLGAGVGCQEPGLTGLVAEKKEGRGAGRNCVNRGSRLGERGAGGPRGEREDHGGSGRTTEGSRSALDPWNLKA